MLLVKETLKCTPVYPHTKEKDLGSLSLRSPTLSCMNMAASSEVLLSLPAVVTPEDTLPQSLVLAAPAQHDFHIRDA